MFLSVHLPKPYDREKSLKEIGKVIAIAENTCARLTGKPADYGMIESVMASISVATEYMKEVKAAWQEIRPDLEKYKRGGVLAD